MGIGLDQAKDRLRRFAEQEAAGISPLYEHLGRHAAQDDEVAGLLTLARETDAHPTLLLAVAHRLVQADPIHPVTRYYPSVGGFDGVDGQTWPVFREFLLSRVDAATKLLTSRFTQTNEVRRAALLYPAVTRAAKEAGGPVALLEVGCSAGLLLGLDTFGYRYQCPGGEQLVAGPAKAPVGLHCALELAEGASLPKLPKKVAVAAKLGLDRSPVDAADEEELAWLEACVWADQVDRVRLLRTAAAAQRRKPPELVTGDAVDDLHRTAAMLPAGLPLVLLTSHVLPYLGEQRRADFIAALAELGADRPLWWVSEGTWEGGLEHFLPQRRELAFAGDSLCTVGLVHWQDGEPRATALARSVAHGQRMVWL